MSGAEAQEGATAASGQWLRMARTLRHLRARQAGAQLLYALRPGVRPRRPGGPPPELAVPRATVAFLPPPLHARWDGAGTVELAGLRAQLDPRRPDWNFDDCGPLFAYQLHFGEYLRVASASPDARRTWILDWIARCRGGVGWDPHPLSVRTMVWLKLLLDDGGAALPLGRDAARLVLDSLAEQVETLSHNLEHRLQANHLLHNRLALAFAGLLLAGTASERWRAQLPLLEAELDDQLGDDGAHVERSPMYHSILLEAVLDVLNAASVTGSAAPSGFAERLRQRAAAMRGALRLWTHPDGQIALFADSALDLAQSPERLHAYAERLGVGERKADPTSWLGDAGYARLVAAPFTLIASLAGPAPAHQPGHAHCDALAFELSIGRERVVTDTGVCEYVPGLRRTLSRATRSHATVEVGGFDQAELWSAHRVGGRPEVESIRVSAPTLAEGACRGWATPRTRHRRTFELAGDEVRIADRFDGPDHRLRFVFPLAPGLRPELRGRSVEVALPGGARVRFDLPELAGAGGHGGGGHGDVGGGWKIERAPYFPRFGEERERAVIVGRSERLVEAAETRIRIV